jgi:hypothetical protein
MAGVLACAMLACRGRGGAPNDGGAPSVTPPSSASSSVTYAASAVLPGEPTAKLDPPPAMKKPRRPTTRLPLLPTESVGDQNFTGVRVPDRFGIAGRIVNARLSFHWLGVQIPVNGPNQITTVTCSASVVTERVISGTCVSVVNFIPPPGSRAPSGSSEGVAAVTNIEFLEPEAEPTPITIASLFRPEMDANAVVRDACKGVLQGDDAKQKPGQKAPCTVDAFVVDADGLVLMWTERESDQLTARVTHQATVPWRTFGKKLRPDGAACSFVWKEDGDDAPEAAKDDPCH